MEQENGTLKCAPPFGYTRHPLNKQMVLIDEEAAAILNLEKDLYLEGNRENILLISGNLFVFSVDGHSLSFVGSEYAVMIIIKESIFHHTITPHIGNFPVIWQPQGLITLLL